MEHIIDGRNRKNKINGEEFVKTLPESIEKGNIGFEPKHPNQFYINDYNSKIVIPNNWLEKKRNWLLTAHPQNESARKRLAASAPMSKPDVDSRYNNFTTELTADNNIISELQGNNNPLSGFLEKLRQRRKGIK